MSDAYKFEKRDGGVRITEYVSGEEHEVVLSARALQMLSIFLANNQMQRLSWGPDEPAPADAPKAPEAP